MSAVLADLALEVEAATALAFRLARAFDGEDPREVLLRRLVTPAAKFWVCKRGPVVAAEALEVLGGNGYIEDSGLPRLYRELPVYSIWEGSGNIMCLDTLRALHRQPEALDALAAEFDLAHGLDPRLDAFAARTLNAARGIKAEAGLRRLCRDLVVTVQAGLLMRHAPGFVAEGFLASRLTDSGGAFGLLPDGLDLHAIVDRASPAA